MAEDKPPQWELLSKTRFGTQYKLNLGDIVLVSNYKFNLDRRYKTSEERAKMVNPTFAFIVERGKTPLEQLGVLKYEPKHARLSVDGDVQEVLRYLRYATEFQGLPQRVREGLAGVIQEFEDKLYSKRDASITRRH